MGSAITTIHQSDAAYSDATITFEATLNEESPAASGYGIVFRYVDDRNYNVFAVDGMGRFSIWALRDAVWTELRDAGENWTLDDAVNPRGTKNTLEIGFSGQHFVGWVNKFQVVDLTVDDPVTAGGIGIYLATTSSGRCRHSGRHLSGQQRRDLDDWLIITARHKPASYNYPPANRDRYTCIHNGIRHSTAKNASTASAIVTTSNGGGT